MGDIEKNIAKQVAKLKRPLPDRIKNAPQLMEHLQGYLNAFFDLNSDRAVGMTSGPIPFTSILKYAEFYQYDREQTQRLLHFIQGMDAKYLKWQFGKNGKP